MSPATEVAVSDTELLAAVGAEVSTPRLKPADSFVLHAPLELAARTALLPYVTPDRRDRARARIGDVATGFAAYDEAVAEPAAVTFDSLEAGAAWLAAALAAGDLDDVDAGAAWFGANAQPDDFARLLADDLVPRLSAAGHAPIFLYLLPRVAPRGELPGTLLRPLARELARQPDWRITWAAQAAAPATATASTGADLAAALRATPILGKPGSDFIFPLMSQAEGSRLAEQIVAPHLGVDLAGGGRALLRTAALSMLLEPPDNAPYGWSHCLTMPQAVLGVAASCANPRAALGVAATYVVGFRTALGSRPLGDRYEPAPTGLDIVDALAGGAATAAATAWHAPDSDVPAIVAELASHASTQRDAHLVKYTLACLDAAAWDRDAARLYLAAAAYLNGFWATA